MGDRLSITATKQLSPDELGSVFALVGTASRADGFSGLNEAALLHLRHPRPEVSHLLAHAAGEIVGYAQLEETVVDQTLSSVGQLVVLPERRRVGIGSALLAELISRSSGSFHIWAMGHSPAAQALAARLRLVVSRELLVMTCPLDEPLPTTAVPPGVTVRTFVVGQDEEAWLRLNARAFASHPEQGQLTRIDLDERLAQRWFDAEGFFLATHQGQLVGFHWTKQHPAELGEVYVLGVDPEAGGRGLGKALLSRGLSHLRDRGNSRVQLYVEADHAQAVGLYSGYGFTVSSRDVMYAQP